MIDIDGIKPLSRLTYINASRREQIFSLKHQNNFGKVKTGSNPYWPGTVIYLNIN